MDFSQHKTLEFRRKFFKIFGAEITITDPENNQLVGFIKMKAWKLREDIRIYSDRSRSQELLAIHARQIIDFSATYDVKDSTTGEPLFSFKSRGIKSTFVRDHWDVLDAAGQQIGALQETSSGLALARRYLGMLPFVGIVIDLLFAFIPQTYSLMDIAGNTTSKIVHRKNPFIVKMQLSVLNPSDALNARTSVAATALLSVIEAAKN